MLSLVAVGPTIRELQTTALDDSPFAPPLLQVVDAGLYALDAAAAELAFVLDDERAEACAIFGAFDDLESAALEASTADPEQRLLIADQLPTSDETPDRPRLEALAEEHARIECDLDRVRHDLWIARRFGGDVVALEREEHELLFRRVALRPEARALAVALARAVLGQ